MSQKLLKLESDMQLKQDIDQLNTTNQDEVYEDVKLDFTNEDENNFENILELTRCCSSKLSETEIKEETVDFAESSDEPETDLQGEGDDRNKKLPQKKCKGVKRKLNEMTEVYEDVKLDFTNEDESNLYYQLEFSQCSSKLSEIEIKEETIDFAESSNEPKPDLQEEGDDRNNKKGVKRKLNVPVCTYVSTSDIDLKEEEEDESFDPLTVTEHDIQRMQEKKKDQREKQGTHRKVDDKRTELCLEHIRSFPTVSSHYSRNTSPNIQYLDDEITSKRHMYDLYKKWMEEYHLEESMPVPWHYYSDILKKHFQHVSCQKPKMDTCKKCDVFRLKLQYPNLTDKEKKTLTTQRNIHHINAQAGYDFPMYLLAGKGPNTMVVCMDLQQALSTPKVSTGIAFYKRKLSTYNFCIHDYRSQTGYMFLWDQVTARRGAAEIISCIDKFVQKYVPPSVDELIIFSDNCQGQNKYFHLILYYLSMVHKGRFREIAHLYFQIGHTFMATDQNFSLIEMAAREQLYIFTPHEYVKLISSCRSGNKLFFVTHMTQEDFLAWDTLEKCATRKVPERCNFSDIVYFRLSDDFKAGYGCGDKFGLYTHKADEKVNIVKSEGSGRPYARSTKQAIANFNLSEVPVGHKYSQPIPLPPKLHRDLQDLVRYLVPAQTKRLYWDKILDTPPSQDEVDEDDPEPLFDANFYDYL